MYKLLILTFKSFIDRTAPLYLCELIEQKSSTNTRLANDAFLFLFRTLLTVTLFRYDPNSQKKY